MTCTDRRGLVDASRRHRIVRTHDRHVRGDRGEIRRLRCVRLVGDQPTPGAKGDRDRRTNVNRALKDLETRHPSECHVGDNHNRLQRCRLLDET
jgi:hypothetical protein